MPAKKFIIPFASTGDKAAVPNTLQPDGTVSYAQGFGPDYELDKTLDPINAKDVPRDQTNQLYFDLTDAVGEQQLYGASLWGADRAPYPINARAYHSDKLWRSNTPNNSGEPGVSGWDDVSTQSPDLLNTIRIDVASAATVDLENLAPNTRNIRITGTTSITGFTLSVGRLYFVSFNGALTLTNNANIVTNTGGNIVTAAGDSCIIRATAANTVEVLCGSFLSEAAIGTRGQTVQNVTGLIVNNTNRTNTTGRPIFVVVSGGKSGAGNTQVFVNDILVSEWGSGGESDESGVSFPLPSGSFYRVVNIPAFQFRVVEVRS